MPRPSSPVHAKASTKCSYLTLESPHHQRQRWACTIQRSYSHSAMRCRGLDHCPGEPSQHPDADVIIISALNWIARANSDDTHYATHIQLTIRRPKTECRRGIDLKNPFTMSNIADGHLVAAKPLRKTQRNSFLHPWNIARFWSGGAYRDRTDDLMLAKQPLSQLS
ncbi:hypothetical protein SPHINGOAX6_40142 [Sphingomonas sp. AX6]|nr:hypothetical protein SPHINGOAX6_40142 [Sphingomonas sp. AX6]